MKTKSIALSVVLLITSTRLALGADAINEALKKGLLEEEANHNLDAAIQAYQSVVSQYDDQRKIAATAVFRLGECYRKQGKTNEAIAQFQRVGRDFADQDTLVTLSAQNLPALSSSASSVGAPDSSFEQRLDQIRAQLGMGEQGTEIQRLKDIIKNSPDLINAKSDGGYTPLHTAVNKGQLAVAQFLLENGADVSARNIWGQSALYVAVSQGYKAMVELLLSKGADVNAKDKGGSTPLYTAAGKGFVAVARTLIEKQADVNAKDSYNATPLHLAVEYGFKDMVGLLLANKADPNVSSSPRPDDPRLIRIGTPLHVAGGERKHPTRSGRFTVR